MDPDPFDSLLNLEEDFYSQGYKQGHEDGVRQSRVEARLFGIEKGFEKFVVMGKLQARARILAARMSPASDSASTTAVEGGDGADTPGETLAARKENAISLRRLPANARLEKHIQTLLALVEPSTLSMANTDEAVAEFDDRLKRALAKEKVIERIIGDDGSGMAANGRGNKTTQLPGSGDMENFGGVR